MSDQDKATRDAENALVQRLRDRGEASDEWLAAEYLAWLKAVGWKPVNVLPPAADWRRASGSRALGAPLDPGVKERLIADCQAATDRHGTGAQPALGEEGRDP